MTNTIRALAALTLLLAFVPRYDTPHVQAQQAALNAIEACMEVASHQTNLLTLQKVRLCNAAPNANGPVDCFVEATRTLMLTDAQGIALCRCTPTNEPIACFRRVRSAEMITQDEIIARCSPTTTQDLGFNCRPRG
jgi:hypothetical protein